MLQMLFRLHYLRQKRYNKFLNKVFLLNFLKLNIMKKYIFLISSFLKNYEKNQIKNNIT